MKNNKLGFGIFLVIIGIILILINIGVIDWSIWSAIFTLWPLLLVVAGVNIMFRHNQMVRLASWIVFLIVIVLFSYFNPAPDRFHFNGFRAPFVRTYAETENVLLDKSSETKSASLKLDVGALSFNVGSTGSGLVDAKVDKDTMTYNVDYSNNKEKANVSFRNDKNIVIGRRVANEASFLLNDSLRWDLDIDMGAVDSSLDLSTLDIGKLDVDCGAASLDVKLGSKNPATEIIINSGVSEIKLDVPRGTGIRFVSEGALNDVDFNDLKVTKDGKTYTTDNYSSASNKIDISASMGLGKVEIRGY
jgi:hypothetical protein